MFVRAESDDMGMNPKGLAIVLNTPHAHWPTLRKRLAPALFLKSKTIENRSRPGQKTFPVQHRQINNAFPAAIRNRGAAHMFNLEL